MQILQLDLDNVKSYRQASIPFAPGTNAICGHNGAGKSTLLEAIGFALFDFLAVKQEAFVRENEKTATVTVHVAAADGRVYHVVRRCGGSSQYHVYDPELDQKLTDGKAETLMWLREFLGVEPATDLPVLFRDAVGVPQGLLTAAFLETASRRKDVFNPLLRVDEYERVWDALREPRRRLEQQSAAIEQQLAGLAAEVKALPELRDQWTALTMQIAQNTQQQTATQAALDDVTTRKTAMETLKAQLDALEKQVAQAAATLQTLSARCADAQTALERAEAAQAVVQATTNAHQAYLAAEERLSALETERSARDQAQQAQQACLHAQDLARQELARLEETLAAIAAAEADMATLAPQVEAQTHLETALDAARRAAAQLKTAEQTLKRERERLADMETRLARMQTELDTRRALEADLQTAQMELDAASAQRETLATQLSAQQAEVKAVGEQAQQATRRLKDAQRDLERARQRRTELTAKQEAIAHGLATLADVDVHLEATRAGIAGLDEQEREFTAQLAASQAELARLHTQRAVLTDAVTADCPVCGAPLSPAHRDDLLAQNQAQAAEMEATLAAAQAGQDTVAKERRRQEKTLRALEKQVQALPRPAEAEEVAGQIAAQQRELDERAAALVAAQDEVAALDARRSTVETALNEGQPRLAEVEAARDAAQTIVRALTARLEALPRPAEAVDLAAQIAAQQRTVAESDQTVAALSRAPDDVSRAEAELARLGDPRRAYQRAADVAAQREAVAEQHAAGVTRSAALAAQRETLDAQVAVYADVDARLATARADREANAPDHQRYLQHEREAAALTERRSTLATLRDDVNAAARDRDAQIAARDALAARYDGAAYTAVAQQHSALRETLAGLSAGLHHQQAQQTAVQEAIARLEARQRELDAAQAERDELIEVQSLLETLRQVLRDAGPAVTRALVEMISLHADRLYADIMQSYGGQNPATRLRWTADYDIVLTGQGGERDRSTYERTFQQLSGGEQMAAALAVRLALLREVSTVDVAFFDEPTANLDRDRRANLAAQVLNVKGFAQLFVISHDDTFEQDTDFVVRIEKRDGESRVVQEDGR